MERDHAVSDPSRNGSSLSAVLKFVREISLTQLLALHVYELYQDFDVGLGGVSLFTLIAPPSQAMPPWWRSVVVPLSLYVPFLGVQLLTSISVQVFTVFDDTHVHPMKIGVAACMLIGSRAAYILWGMGLVVQKFCFRAGASMISSWQT